MASLFYDQAAQRYYVRFRYRHLLPEVRRQAIQKLIPDDPSAIGQGAT